VAFSTAADSNYTAGSAFQGGGWSHAWLALAGFTATGVADAGVFKVGTFSKTTAAAPAVQAVPHGLGTTPRALIFWSAGRTDETVSTGASMSIGFNDGVNSRAASAAASHGVSPSVASRRLADAAFTSVGPGLTVRLEATLQGWDDATFTLRWTVNDASAERIHYLALGGEDILTKVVTWPMPTATGAVTVTGVGFQPDVLLNLTVGPGVTLGTSATDADLGLGAVDATGRVWCNAFGVTNGISPTRTTSWQQVTNALMAVDGPLSGPTELASFVAMTPDGFRLSFTTASALGGTALSLAIKGVQADADSFGRNGGGPDNITSIGFSPAAVLLSPYEYPANGQQPNVGWYLGVSDGTSSRCAAFAAADNVSPAAAWSLQSESQVVAGLVGDTGARAYAATYSPLATGFALRWAVVDALMDQQVFLALRPLQSCGLCDTTPPDTTIVSGPLSTTASSDAEFDFTSNETLSTFECLLDGAASFSPCTSPTTFTGLGSGAHNFEVRARDPSGNFDPTPASYAWAVQLADGGLTLDAGSAPPRLTVGCGCGAHPGPCEAALMALLLAHRARPRRSRRLTAPR
jgi:hypothetical protein